MTKKITTRFQFRVNKDNDVENNPKDFNLS